MTNRIEGRTYADRAEYLRAYKRDNPQPEHDPIGDPCAECGLDAAIHRKRKRDRPDETELAGYDQDLGKIKYTKGPVSKSCPDCCGDCIPWITNGTRCGVED